MLKPTVGISHDHGWATLRLWLSVAIVITEAAATVCQFVQRTDPRFPLVYFTMCSGVLAGTVALLGLLGFQGVDRGRVAAGVGVLLSAVIFAVIIAPATPTGTWFQPWDDVWVRVATVLFHGVAPILVAASLSVNAPVLPLRAWMAAAYAWPTIYLAAIGVAAYCLHLKIPYPFLSPDQIGWAAVFVALIAMCALIAATAWLLRSPPRC